MQTTAYIYILYKINNKFFLLVGKKVRTVQQQNLCVAVEQKIPNREKE